MTQDHDAPAIEAEAVETDPPEAIEPEAVTGELMQREPGPTPIEVAAQAAIDNPGVPGRDEFLSIAAQARILSLSGAAPQAVRGNPHLAFHLALTGRDLGISPSAALNLIDVIDGQKGPQLSLSPQLLNGQVRRLGLGSIVPAIRDDERAVAVVLGPDGHLDPRCGPLIPQHWPDMTTRKEMIDIGHTPDQIPTCECRGIIGFSEFTWADAQVAGLAGPECRPGHHNKTITKTGRNNQTYKVCGCNQGYITYPKRMLWWRCAGFAADDWFPEASLGLYQPEALGAVVDEEGRPIDASSVELPPGYAIEEAARARADAPPEPASAEDVAELQARIDQIKMIPDAAKALGEMWTEKSESGAPRLNPIARLWAKELPVAKALIKHIEDRIGRGEWGDPPAAPEGETPESPTPSPEGQEGASETAQGEESAAAPLDADLVAIAERVKAMTMGEVAEALSARGLTPEGNDDAQRLRLAQAWVTTGPIEPAEMLDAATVAEPDMRPLIDRLEAMTSRDLTAACVVHFIHSAGSKADKVERLRDYLTEQEWEPGDPILTLPIKRTPVSSPWLQWPTQGARPLRLPL